MEEGTFRTEEGILRIEKSVIQAKSGFTLDSKSGPTGGSTRFLVCSFSVE